MVDLNKFKPLLKDLIQYYYENVGGTGGTMHIATDDGNLDRGSIWSCQEYAEKEKDHLAYFILTIMRHFKTEELEEMYEDNFWGMRGESNYKPPITFENKSFRPVHIQTDSDGEGGLKVFVNGEEYIKKT